MAAASAPISRTHPPYTVKVRDMLWRGPSVERVSRSALRPAGSGGHSCGACYRRSLSEAGQREGRMPDLAAEIGPAHRATVDVKDAPGRESARQPRQCTHAAVGHMDGAPREVGLDARKLDYGVVKVDMTPLQGQCLAGRAPTLSAIQRRGAVLPAHRPMLAMSPWWRSYPRVPQRLRCPRRPRPRSAARAPSAPRRCSPLWASARASRNGIRTSSMPSALRASAPRS